MWSYWTASLSDPGSVPQFYGYDYEGAKGIVKRRYCLTCQCFKPDRCHHCSACNRCVLNMDHHCLWLNNCVGFWNRKAFMLVLIYAESITLLIEVTMLNDFVKAIEWGCSDEFFSKYDDKFHKNMLVIVSYVLNSIILALMTTFLRFHWMLATQNKTTIENLENDGFFFYSKYDIGVKENLAQIFGDSPALYALPIVGHLRGDGLSF